MKAPRHCPWSMDDARLALQEHASTRLVGLSFDSAASPYFRLSGLARDDEHRGFGWGFAWYPDQQGAALVIKDAVSVGDNAMTKLLRDWERFESTNFLAHLRGATRAVQERDTQPFARTHGGRDWIFAHNGDLEESANARSLASQLPLGERPVFEPIGRTDSEHAFCWLLAQVRESGARSLLEVGFPRLHGWLDQLDQLGTVNVLLSDGQDLVAYADREAYNPLHWARFVPPDVPKNLRALDVEVGLQDARDRTRTCVVFATEPMAESGFQVLQPGQMLAVRRGSVVFNSHDPIDRLWVVPQAPPVAGLTTETNPHGGVFIEGSFAQSSLQQTMAQNQTSTEASVDTMNQPQAVAEPQEAAPVGTETFPPTGGFADASTSVSGQLQSVSSGSAQAFAQEPIDSESESQISIPSENHFERQSSGRLLTVFHETTYHYQAPVERSFHLLRLQPIHDRWQDLLRYEMFMSVDGRRQSYLDVFGNHALRVDIETPFSELIVRAKSLVRVRGGTPRDLQSPSRRYQIPLVWMPWQRQMMTPYLLPPELPETQLRELSDYAMSYVERQDYDLVQTLMDMNIGIYRDYRYVSGSTNMATTPFEVFSRRKGVCQDFANLFICLARLLGVPARYRVGYIYTGADYENKVQSDASHAWVELYLPWLGWQGFDPTNGVFVNRDHVRVATGRNYGDATPTSGTLYKGGLGERLRVEVRVEEVG